MLIDLHLHTLRYSACGWSTAAEMAEGALRYGLDGIVITDHNVSWTEEEADALRAAYPTLAIYRGAEVTDDRGNDFLCFGGIDVTGMKGLPAEEVIRAAHHRGAAVALAHPFRKAPTVPEALRSVGIEAVEVLSGNILNYIDGRIEALRRGLELPGIAGSDAHHDARVGLFATRFPQRVRDERDLAEAICQREYDLYADLDRLSDMIAMPPDHMRHVHLALEQSAAMGAPRR